MGSQEGKGPAWRRRVRGGRAIPSAELQQALPSHDSEEFEYDTKVVEAEQVVTAALGRWATSAGLNGTGEYMPYRAAVTGREMIRLLAAAAREDQDVAA